MPSIRSSLLLVFLLQFSLSGRAAVPGALVGSFAPELTAEAALSKTSLSSDGGLLLVGDFEAIAGSLRPGFAKLRADGSLDPHFQPAVGMGKEPMLREIFSLRNGRFFAEAQGPITVGPFGILDVPPPTRFFLQPDGSIATSPFLKQLDPKHSITPLLEHENRLFVRAPGKFGPEFVVLDTTTLLQLNALLSNPDGSSQEIPLQSGTPLETTPAPNGTAGIFPLGSSFTTQSTFQFTRAHSDGSSEVILSNHSGP